MIAKDDYFQVGAAELEGTSIAALLASQSKPLWISGVDFSGCDLSRMKLASICFERCRFEGTNFTAADLSGSVWRGCRASAAVFRSAILEDARFISSDLNNTIWERSKLSHARFEESKLTGASFADSSSLGLTFNNCVLRSACLTGISFYKAELVNLDFTDADVSYCDFRQATFVEGGSLSMARVNNARFDQADLREASLQGLRLTDAKMFKGAIISKNQATMLLSGLGLFVQ